MSHTTAIQDIKFSTSWNNKLLCQYFTTIRLSKKYEIGQKLRVVLADRPRNMIVEVRAIHKTKLDDLNEFTCGLDTGYGVEETKNILKTMYKNYDINWNTHPLFIFLLKDITPAEPEQK